MMGAGLSTSQILFVAGEISTLLTSRARSRSLDALCATAGMDVCLLPLCGEAAMQRRILDFVSIISATALLMVGLVALYEPQQATTQFTARYTHR